MSSFGYVMPSYFMGMPQVGNVPASLDSDLAERIKAIENDYLKASCDLSDSGRSTESINRDGSLTTMQRLKLLVDEGTWCPLKSLYRKDKDEISSSGIILGLGKIHDKWAVISACDNKKPSPTIDEGRKEKLEFAFSVAKNLNIPFVYLVDTMGLKEDVFGLKGGLPLYKSMELQKAGVPFIAGVFGDNLGEGALEAVSATAIISHEKASLSLGKEFVGTALLHFGSTGILREVYREEEGVIAGIKKFMDAMPAYNENFFRVDDPRAPYFLNEDLYTLLSKDDTDVHEFIGRWFDNSEFTEYREDYGPEVVTGIAKMNGLLCGVVAVRGPSIPSYPEYREEKKASGKHLYRQGLLKMNEFITLCGRDRLPLVFIDNSDGFDAGEEAEKAEILALADSVIYSIENAEVPHITLTLKKCDSEAHYLFASLGKMGIFTLSLSGNKESLTMAASGCTDEAVSLVDARKYIGAFIGASYQNPKKVCAFHQMLLPKIMRDYDAIYKRLD